MSAKLYRSFDDKRPIWAAKPPRSMPKRSQCRGSFAGATIVHAAITAALGLMRGNLAMLADSALAAAPRAEVQAIVVRAEALLTQARAALTHVAG